MALFTAIAQQVLQNAGASHLDVFQDATGARVVRVYRIHHFISMWGGSGSALQVFKIFRTTGCFIASGQMAAIYSHDPDTLSVSPEITAGIYRTVVETHLFRQYVWPNVVMTATNTFAAVGGWQCHVPMSIVWKAGYDDPNIQPITCRPGQGVDIRHDSGTSTILNNEFEIEFSDDLI